jgi:hypothetical protein
MKRPTKKPEDVPAASATQIAFTAEERDYIVDNFETDLLLTEVGMRLVERFSVDGGSVSVEATETEIQKFLAELREEFVWKINRVAQPSILRGLARRLLPDYQELTPLTFQGLLGG